MTVNEGPQGVVVDVPVAAWGLEVGRFSHVARGERGVEEAAGAAESRRRYAVGMSPAGTGRILPGSLPTSLPVLSPIVPLGFPSQTRSMCAVPTTAPTGLVA